MQLGVPGLEIARVAAAHDDASVDVDHLCAPGAGMEVRVEPRGDADRIAGVDSRYSVLHRAARVLWVRAVVGQKADEIAAGGRHVADGGGRTGSGGQGTTQEDHHAQGQPQAQSRSQQQALVVHLVPLSMVVGQGELLGGMPDNGQINVGYRSYVEGDINGLGGIVGPAISNRQDVSIEKPSVDQSDFTPVEGET